MSHLIESTDTVITTRGPAWHGFDIQLPADCTSDQLREIVFPWYAGEQPIVTYGYGTAGATGVATYKAVVRSDTGAVLSILPESYGVVQYGEALSLLDAAIGEGTAKYITAGTLKGGAKGWALAELQSAAFEVAGVQVKPYLLLTTAHDGSLSIRVHFTGVYVVCANTVSAALIEAGIKPGRKPKYLPNVIQIRHSANAKERVAAAAKLIASARSYFGRFNEAALRLVNERYTTTEFQTLVAQLFPLPPRKDGEEREQVSKAQAKVIALFQGEQRAAAQAPGTKWAALNAVTEYVDHHARRRSVESRFDAILFGRGAQIRQEALDALLLAA